MAAAVYGGSPRHSRHSSASQSSLHHQQSPYHHHSSSIIVPPVSYLSGSQSSGTATSPYHQHLRMADLMHRRDKSAKRKSAVEMLAESKPFYVKSEMVLDRQQQLNIRGSNSASSCKFFLHFFFLPNMNIDFDYRHVITFTHTPATASSN